MDNQTRKNHQKTLEIDAIKGLWRTLPYCIIVCVTIIVFFPSLHNGFTNWDDDTYVTDNPDIRGFSSANIAKVFSTAYASNFQPLVMLTYMAETSLFGLNPAVFHGTNLILHCVNALLVFVLLRGLIGNGFAAGIAALLFAIHPLRVESVAWIAERKDVLSAFFYLLALWTYIQLLCKNAQKFYWLTLFAMVFSLLAKPSAVSLPFVLLLLDYLYGKKNEKILLRKAPFFALSAIFVVVTLLTQQHTGAINGSPALPVLQRICVPFYGLLFYIVKIAFPVKLAALYPLPQPSDVLMKIVMLVSPIIVFAAVSILYFRRNQMKKTVFGSLFFLITLLPVLQIVPIGSAVVADRYTYIPVLGICFIVAVFLNQVFKSRIGNNGAGKAVVSVMLLFIFITLSFITFQRCSVWNSSMTLWNDAIEKYPNAIAYNNRAMLYGIQGKTERAISDYTKAIGCDPGFARAYNNRGIAYLNCGMVEQAQSDFNETIKLDPKYYDAFNNRGIIYAGLHDFENALDDFTHAITVKPDYTKSYTNRGIVYMEKGVYDLAIRDFDSAISCDPANTTAIEKRAEALDALKK